MTDKELIKEEIERLIDIEEETSHLDKLSFNSGRWKALTQMKAFIDSLPEESASEDLEKAAEKYSDNASNIIEWSNGWEDLNDCEYVERAFKAGAEWQKQQMKETLQTEYEKGRFDMQQEMMKDTVEGEVVYQIGSAEIAPTDIQYKVMSDRVYIPNVKLGDKVKIIIIKEEQQ